MVDSYKWYVLQVKSGSEETVCKIIESSIKSSEKGSNFIKSVFLPRKHGEKEKVKSRLVPGYLFIEMNMSKSNLRDVLAISSVIKFLGDNNGAKVISEHEIEKIKNSIDNLRTPDTIELSVQVGDEVKVIDGPFQHFVGKVEFIDNAKKMVKILIMIFGRSTPVDLEINKVEKID